MSYLINEECINCGACEPECPNKAIYAGGEEYELNGEMHPALSEEFYYIVSEKCTECVGFHEEKQCVSVCPVDSCVPNPNHAESREQLLDKARALHPDKTF